MKKVQISLKILEMDDSNLKSSMNAVHRDVSTYVTELEKRISSLEDSMRRSEQSSTMNNSQSINTVQKQMEDIIQSINTWQSGQLEQQAEKITTQLNDYINIDLPQAISPLTQIIDDWKSRFNTSLTHIGQQYQQLSQSLNIDTTKLEKSSKLFNEHKRNIANLQREIANFPSMCEQLNSELTEVIDSQERELNVSLSSIGQQLQLDLMRAKATTNSTLSQSLTNCQTSSLSEFFTTLQADVNAHCSQMEQNVRDINSMLDTGEKQWENDVEALKEEIKNEVSSLHHSAGSDFALQQRLAEAQEKLNEVEQLIQSM